MPHDPAHELDIELPISIARQLLDAAEPNRCMNCVLTQYINVGAILLASIPEEARYRAIAKLTVELVTQSAAIAGDMLGEGETLQ